MSTIENSLDKLSISDKDQILISFCLESFLFQSQAFIDFFMLFITISLGINKGGSMTKDKFNKMLKKNISKCKIMSILDYFEKYVYNEEKLPVFQYNWGGILKSLRDKIAHRDIIRTSFDSNEMLVDKVLHNWPTIKGITIERFCQDMQNYSFDLIRNIFEILYEQKWPV